MVKFLEVEVGDTAETLRAKWNRDRIAEIRNEFHWQEFIFGLAIGVCAILVIIYCF